MKFVTSSSNSLFIRFSRSPTGAVLIVFLGLWTVVFGSAAAVAVPPDASTPLREVIGEYRSPSQTLTVYESGNLLFVQTAGEVSDAIRPISPSLFSTDNGQLLKVRKTAPVSIEWQATAFERYDLGAERIASIQARVHADPRTLRANALAAHPPTEFARSRTFDLIPLVSMVPNVKLDVRYATSDNFIGLPLYTMASAYLQRPAAEALAEVARSLAKQGLGLTIFDGYRPWFVTKMFWDAVPPEAHVFVADPSEGSKHNRGCAVDLSLYDLKTGRPIEMTSRYDEMSPRSYANYSGGTTRERWFRDLLRQEMQARGFQVYPEEWWHFDYQDWDKYPIGNRAFEDLQATTRE